MIFAVDDEELVGVVGQFLETAQIAQHDFKADVFAHRHHVEDHERAHRVFRVGHGRAQLFAAFGVEGLEDVLDDLGRQVGCEIGELVGVERFGRSLELRGRHALDERFTHGIRDLEQDLAVAFGLDQVPDVEALSERQRVEDVADVGRVQLFELGRQFRFVLLVYQALDHLVARHVLLADQVFDGFLACEQVLHFAQVLLDIVGMEFLFLRHGIPAAWRSKSGILRAWCAPCDCCRPSALRSTRSLLRCNTEGLDKARKSAAA